ncbi:hypothetical protein ZIOFF_035771 [Zingiber officinale]|uniref:Uncharacterized protein n=1 Tax=Zingiber officinale TaxID=94328 RepID=A0A8J5GL02_ZINOF|nr:hypothetical protein ZIOFF_035771 [Zingiber officinale]
MSNTREMITSRVPGEFVSPFFKDMSRPKSTQIGRIYPPPPPSSSCIGQAASSHPFILSHSRDITTDLLDECLTFVFHFLDAADRQICSLAAPALFSCFEAISNLTLCSSRHSASINNDALELIASRCPNLLSLKLRACCDLMDARMAALSRHCPFLCKLSVYSCCFGAKGIHIVLEGCLLLEELSVKRLHDLHDLTAISGLAVVLFALIANSPYLKTLKLIYCSKDWDTLLEAMDGQVSDRGLIPLSARVDLKFLHLVKMPECITLALSLWLKAAPASTNSMSTDGRRTTSVTRA